MRLSGSLRCSAELLLVYSRGSHELYRKLVSANYLLFCTALVMTGYVALLMYERLGPTAPFYVAGGAAAAYAVGFGIFFCVRLGRTEAGVRGGLRAAEEELRARA